MAISSFVQYKLQITKSPMMNNSMLSERTSDIDDILTHLTFGVEEYLNDNTYNIESRESSKNNELDIIWM